MPQVRKLGNIDSPDDLSLTLKLVHKMQAEPGQLSSNLEARLSEQQKQTLLINHALLLLLGNKAEACQEQLQHLKARSVRTDSLVEHVYCMQTCRCACLLLLTTKFQHTQHVVL